MTLIAHRGDLPLSYERAFRPWRYSVSHRELVLRASETDTEPALEALFVGVAAMKLRRVFNPLTITRASRAQAAEIQKFADLDREIRSSWRTLIVSDGTHEGFVVCNNLQVFQLPH
ncbi:hypothetical protein ACIRBX_35920 [Kitasatospora sp. NPDC096147]|uniref:hypothetical protein n=1 Tax=Kitasatospora sp. NPDC096147 TaxID=3364093 RepID=UPI0037F62F96